MNSISSTPIELDIPENAGILKPLSRSGLEILKGFILSKCPARLAIWIGLEQNPVYSDPVTIARIRYDETIKRFRIDYACPRASVGLPDKPLDFSDSSTSISEDELIVPVLVDVLEVEGEDPMFRWEIEKTGPFINPSSGFARHIDPHACLPAREK